MARVHPLRCKNSFEKGLLETRKTRGTRGMILRKKNIFAFIGMLPMAKTRKNLNRLNKQVVQLWQQGDYEQAITIAEQILELAR
jgi:protein-arginine kinase activator protein McsA